MPMAVCVCFIQEGNEIRIMQISTNAGTAQAWMEWMEHVVLVTWKLASKFQHEKYCAKGNNSMIYGKASGGTKLEPSFGPRGFTLCLEHFHF